MFLKSENGVFYPEVNQRTVVIGKIKKFKDFPDAPRKISLIVNDVSINGVQFSFETVVNNNGDFVFNVPLYNSQNCCLKYADFSLHPFIVA